MKKIISFALVLVMVTSNLAYGEEIGIENNVRAYILADYRTGEILNEYNSNEVVEIASITKLMTYLVTMDEVARGRISLGDLVTMDEESLKIGGSSLRLKLGQALTVDELLNMTLVVSANNAAHRLARHVAGTEDHFVYMMNRKAREIGLTSAVFYNSSGLPIEGKEDQNKMLVTDLLLMSRYIISNYPEVLSRTSIPFIRDSRDRIVKSTNPILGRLEGVDGLKTGFTNKAGYSFIGTLVKKAKKDGEEDLRLIGIVMGTRSELGREKATYRLMDYGIETYTDKLLLDQDVSVERVEDDNLKNRSMDLYPRDNFRKVMSENDDILINSQLDENIKYPIKEGARVGVVRLLVNGEEVFKTDLIVKDKIKKANFLLRFARKILKRFQDF